ncbi:MAG TPA: bifunctional diaminohydroxyphosphoribosylaminopyrimidine deaminase/5-amino-6-(5-phosphoribosylamino)uracil reductase RibD [Rubricoccaceae bacterium]|jgi:diaminohydroxyphosphoribosylaminopyrimidine deaminase/5-amino-6-(5-phosphoribosylamino)uracil reductase
MTEDDAMRRALALAARGAGAVSPNPLVGAVLLGPDGTTWGEGWHGRWGGPHAEVWAVRDAERRGFGARLAEATAVVTLEPCSHWGRTPPCADLLIERRVARVVVAHEDPFPAVAGRGIARLRAAGIPVEVGLHEAEARALNAAFLTHTTTGRPLVTLKVATSLDGQVATATGDSRWVTGPEARVRVHAWRADADAVLVGAGTARADNPSLTVRDAALAPGARGPLRVVLDRAGTLPPGLRLFTDADAGRTLAVTVRGAQPAYAAALVAAGGQVWTVPEASGHLDLPTLLDRLGAGTDTAGTPLPDARRVVQSVLVEAGPGLATALLRARLADRLRWFVAPKLVGAGTPAVRGLGVAVMADALTWSGATWETVGTDALLSASRT